jgi:hypothetical protein
MKRGIPPLSLRDAGMNLFEFARTPAIPLVD